MLDLVGTTPNIRSTNTSSTQSAAVLNQASVCERSLFAEKCLFESKNIVKMFTT